jgi:ATP-dependent RNA helicase RhlE
MTFSDFTLIDPILKALQDEKYETPTPIQAQAIPVALLKKDILGCAQTGTGKTAAFAIPILQLLNKEYPHPKQIRSLILTPTRELAIQIEESFKSYGRYLKLKHTVIFGGVSQHAQTATIRNGVDILVATPGRLLDLINQRYISLKNIEIFVLDEADRMLDMGFINDVKKIIALLPKQKQTLFFSATMPNEIQKLSDTLLHQPTKIVVTPVSSTAERIEQSVFHVAKEDKNQLLLYVMKEYKINSALVFTRTKHGADKVVKYLAKVNISAEAIHGNKSQNARQRALTNFKEGKIKVLVATDIAARGIDIDKLEYVINFDISNLPETYVHRIGRTGRAGKEGEAFSFCDPEERAYLKDLEKLTNQKIPVNENHPFALKDYSFIPPAKKENKGKPARQQQRNFSRPKKNFSHKR